jgi:hypothetical protein
MAKIYQAWKHKREIIVTNPSASAGQQAFINLPFLPGMRFDFRDIRVSDLQGRELNFYVESFTNFLTAKVWIKLPASDKKAYLYYGNGQAASASNGDKTFEFFDNFKASTTLNAAKWSKYGTASIVNGQLKLGTTSSTSSEIKGLVTFGEGYRAIIRANIPLESGQFAGVGFLKLNNPGLGGGGGGWVTYGTAPLTSFIYDGYTTRTSTSNYSGAFHVFDFSRKGSGATRLIIDGSTVVSNQTGSRTDALPVGFRNYDANKYVYIDYAFVIKYAAVDPTLSLGQKFITQPKTFTYSLNTETLSTAITCSPAVTIKDFIHTPKAEITLKGNVSLRYPQFFRPETPGPFKAWKFRGDIKVSNPSTTDGVQAEVYLQVSPGMRSDFRDLRITDIRGKPLKFWIDIRTPGILSNYNIIDCWVKLPANDSKIYYYYGNGAASSVSSGDDTFEFFDEFEGSGNPNSTKWDIYKKGSASATVTLYGDCLQLAGAPGVISSGNAVSKQTFSRPCIINYRDKLDDYSYPDTTIGSGALQDWAGAQSDWWHTYQASAYGIMVNNGSNSWFIEKSTAGAASSTLRTGSEATYPSLNNFKSHSIILGPSDITFKSGDTFESQTVLGSITDSTYTTGLKIHFGQGEYSSGAGGNRYIDRVFVRKYDPVLPTLTAVRHYPIQQSLYTYSDSDIGASSFINLTAPDPVLREFRELRDYNFITANVKKSILDTSWSLSANFADDTVPGRGSTFKFNAYAKGAPYFLFKGRVFSIDPTLSYFGNTVKLDAADGAQNLAIQKIPWDARVLTLGGSFVGWDTWINYLVNYSVNDLTPCVINRPDMPTTQITIDPKTTRLEAIKKIADYCNYIFFTKWINTGTLQAPSWKTGVYFLHPADIDLEVGGLDLPEPVTLTYPDPSLIDLPTLSPDLENNYNTVTLYGTGSANGLFGVCTVCTPEVVSGAELMREYVIEDNLVNEKCSTDEIEAVKWLNYFTSRQATIKVKFVNRFDLQLYQRLRFGAGFSNRLQSLTNMAPLSFVRCYDPRDPSNYRDDDMSGIPRPAWLRITDINYNCGPEENITEITLIPDFIYSNADPYLEMEWSQYIGNGYLKPQISDSTATTQSLIDNTVSKQAGPEEGTIMSVASDGKTAEVLTKDGKTVTVNIIT